MFDKLKEQISPDMADKIADAVEENVTKEQVGSIVEKVTGSDELADKLPDDAGKKLADGLRDALGGDGKP
jgi:hypothetical protein